MDLRAA